MAKVPRSVAAAGAFPLAVRSHFSFLDSTLAIPDIVALAKTHGLSTVALCDRGNLHGAVEFFVAARSAGLHPVLGAEVGHGGSPLWLYVENQVGYGNLCRILSGGRAAAISDGGGGLPEFDPEGQATEGLVGVSADVSVARWFPGRFYRALVTRADLRRYEARGGGAPAVPVLPVHYATPADRRRFDIVQSIRTLTLLGQAHPGKRSRGNYHFRTPGDLESVFGRRPELVAHTLEIGARCQFAFALGRLQFPEWRPPDGSEPREYLRRLVERGLRARYGAGRGGALRGQLETELEMIAAVGYEDYFLVVWDLLRACRERGIEWITRGSAADSLVCYCLGISGVCPIRFDLYFRRFLNRERMALNKLPDIDIDFAHDRKDDVVDLLFARYGREHCAVVGGFSTFQARSAFAEAAKVLGVAEREVRRFTEHFPWGFGGGWPGGADGVEPVPGGRLARLLRTSPECGDVPLDEEIGRAHV